jgi:hypothetical protein
MSNMSRRPRFSDARTKQVIDNRERIGRRWHRLEGEALARFVDDDPDVRARIEGESEEDIAPIVAKARVIVKADAETLAMWRQDVGDDEFEKLLAILAALAARE